MLLAAIFQPALTCGQEPSAIPSAIGESAAPITTQFMQDGVSSRTGPIDTERPEFTESSPILPRGRIQLETGYTFLKDDNDQMRLRQHLFPGLLARISVLDRLELRFGWPGIIWDRLQDRGSGATFEDSGAADIDLGVKFDLWEQSNWRPRFAMIASMSLPIGSEPFSAERVQPLLNLPYSWALDEHWSIGGSTGFGAMNDREDRFLEMHQSLLVQYFINDRWATYGEWFAFLRRNSADDRPQHYLDGGLSCRLTENTQLDWRAGIGVNDRAQDFFTGVGFSVRF